MSSPSPYTSVCVQGQPLFITDRKTWRGSARILSRSAVQHQYEGPLCARPLLNREQCPLSALMSHIQAEGDREQHPCRGVMCPLALSNGRLRKASFMIQHCLRSTSRAVMGRMIPFLKGCKSSCKAQRSGEIMGSRSQWLLMGATRI